MKALVTGGAGYIGSELIGALLNSGHTVTVLDNLMYDPTSLLRYVPIPGFSFVKGDVRDTQLLLSLLSQHDSIIPLAALVGFPVCDKAPQAAIDINLEANRTIAENKSRDQLLIYPCTNSGYGTSADGSPRTEESPINPVSLYGKTKVEAEAIYRQTENCVTFRLATVYGPSSRMRTDLLVNNFVWRALKDRLLVLYECKFMRNYVHILDICEAFLHTIREWETCKNETYNVGNDALNMNKLELAQRIQKQLPLEIVQAEYTQDPDVRDYVVSSEKFYRTGYQCRHDLDAGITQLIQAYKMIDTPWYGNY